MYANGRVVLSDRATLVVPAESVVIRDGRSYVLKLADDSMTSKAMLQPVTAGRREGGDVEVSDGLTAGDRVVVKGAGFPERWRRSARDAGRLRHWGSRQRRDSRGSEGLTA